MSESDLRANLATSLAPRRRAELDRGGLRRGALRVARGDARARAAGSRDPTATAATGSRGLVSRPAAATFSRSPAPGSAEHARLAAVGDAALRRGELAFCVLAGGMATRMGGVVKALVEAFDGQTFLDLRLDENAHVVRGARRPVPLWLMTSEATDGPTREALAKAGAPPHVATFTQDLACA